MTKELYDELKQMEDRLCDISIELDDKGKLYDSWWLLYSYLEKVEVNDLE